MADSPGSFLVSVGDVAAVPTKAVEGDKGSTRFLGRPGAGPWVYYSERPAGAVIPNHRHRSDRTEFLLEGEIEFRFAEPPADGAPQVARYRAGTLSYVTAGTAYGYTVLSDAKILLMFPEEPGINYV